MRAADNGKRADAILGVGDLQTHSGSAVGDDCALYLLDREERVVAWYAGAVRVYGFPTDEVLGHKLACLTLIPTPATIHEPVGCEKSSNRPPTNSMWRLRAGGFERTDPDSGRMLSR